MSILGRGAKFTDKHVEVHGLVRTISDSSPVYKMCNIRYLKTTVNMEGFFQL